MNMTQTKAHQVAEVLEFYKNFNKGCVIPQAFNLALACMAALVQSRYPQGSELHARAELVQNSVTSNIETVAWVVSMHQLLEDVCSANPNIQLAYDVLTQVKKDAFPTIDVDVFSKYM
jgi:hypothetical protein